MNCEKVYSIQNTEFSFYDKFCYIQLFACYGIFTYSYYKLIKYFRKNNENNENYNETNNNNNYQYQYQTISDFIKNAEDLEDAEEAKSEDGEDGEEVKSVESVESIDSDDSEETKEAKVIKEINLQKKQEIFDNMLSKNTLERSLVLHYIFKIKGDYISKIHKKSNLVNSAYTIFTTYNSFKEFKNLEEYFNEEYLNDELKEFSIGNKEYNITQGMYNFISWLYNSNIYEYLTTNQEIKERVLKEMYDEKLLKGNVFLRYHLQLLGKAVPKEAVPKAAFI